MFKIVCAGWKCGPFIKQTLDSIAAQSRTDYEIGIHYEAQGDNEAVSTINDWLEAYPDTCYTMTINRDVVIFDTQSRVELIEVMQPEDDDIIIWLDLDGDRFAHPDVLAHLADYYNSGDVLMTYGNYMPDPYDAGCPPVRPYPPDVVAARSYRSFRQIYFNHLRTMSGKVFNAIPRSQFFWSDGRGWYEKGCDVIFTFCGLELAGPRFKVIDEVLMLYNSINPNSAWRIASQQCDACTQDFLVRPPLEMLL